MSKIGEREFFAAAKACGVSPSDGGALEFHAQQSNGPYGIWIDTGRYWNPLTNANDLISALTVTRSAVSPTGESWYVSFDGLAGFGGSIAEAFMCAAAGATQ